MNLKDEDSEIFTKFAKLIQNRLKRYSEVDFTNPAPRNSPVFGDDKYLAGFPISLYVAHQATVAMENIASLWDLIAHERDGKVAHHKAGCSGVLSCAARRYVDGGRGLPKMEVLTLPIR
ncbi:hypothetical protein, partial [Kocuria marina]|uniref:hypothetical protein n=1 Tax=Kocuria marina TaxID=223184 RepID=UPI003460153E